ncbi:MAG: Unknown protein [uncultured Sulfurovum sp.]|uniref:Uncharacterized protein n=1 Tax=uncultured Sulfurovum sp. TaxID=269237 RepID=A0A6S6U640_9BACT|nr:MAG: Unknown protein [uncultured Sulfurovum sp.]
MSTFRYHRNNNHRYNIYENFIEESNPKSYYTPLRNTLFIIAFISTLLMTLLLSIDFYQKKEYQVSYIFLPNTNQKNQVSDEISPMEITKVVSDNILKKIEAKNILQTISDEQLELIIQNVMEKIKNSPNEITYTQK